MPLYEHVLIARQDLSTQQVDGLLEEFSQIVTENGGTAVVTENWGLRTLAYKIKKNRKGHYGFFRLDAPPTVVAELERRLRIHEDVLRCMTIKVDAHAEGSSVLLQNKNQRDDMRRREH